MREVQGARHEPPLYSCARCFVTRRRRSWAIAMGITKKNRIVAAARARGCRRVVAWLSLPIWHLEYRHYPRPGIIAGVIGKYLGLISSTQHLASYNSSSSRQQHSRSLANIALSQALIYTKSYPRGRIQRASTA
jgi:hypothetical protein